MTDEPDKAEKEAGESLRVRTPTKVVSARLGHASTSITEDVYSQILDTMQEQATDDLERVILGAKKA
jgi:integrase